MQWFTYVSRKYYVFNAVLNWAIKLFQNYFSLRRRPSEIILFQRVESCLNLFRRLAAAHKYFSNMFVVAEIILK